MNDLLIKAQTLPRKPGCYLMKSHHGVILYVGKAKDLRNRVTDYFSQGVKPLKTEILISRISDFDFIITENETEAFVLENNLIKKHKPKYNILLRDDKSYPYVVIDYAEEYPKLSYVRRFKQEKGMEFFGPFVMGSNISQVLRILQREFTLRDCSLSEFKKRKKPCLLYQMKHCSAPCVALISKDDYLKDLELAVNFFTGKGRASLNYLEKKMAILAESEEFEAAAVVRDDILVLKKFLEISMQENAEIRGRENVDIIAFFQGDRDVDLALYMIRNGLLIGHKNFSFNHQDLQEDLMDEILRYMYQYYSKSTDSLPDKIIIPLTQDRRMLLKSALVSCGTFKVEGTSLKYKSLIRLTQKQAVENQRVRSTQQESIFSGLLKLKELLSLKEKPSLIECYDVAIWQGKSPTASQVSFIDGIPNKAGYRYYNLKELPEGNNDFQMLREVMRRRLAHGELPDLIIVDGGKGQVSAFQEVLKEFSLNIPVAGIAKAKSLGGKKTQERLIIPGRANPFLLAKHEALLRIIVQMRNEAHRFSRKLHHKREKKRSFASWIDDIKGIGPVVKNKMLTRMEKSMEELKAMGWEELRTYFGLNERNAILVQEYLQKI